MKHNKNTQTLVCYYSYFLRVNVKKKKKKIGKTFFVSAGALP